MDLDIIFLPFSFEEGRVIIREGHIGQKFYMVYSGSVFVNVNDKSPSGTLFVKNEAVLSKGDSFGASINL